MSFGRLATVVSAIATEAGQTAYTAIGGLERGRKAGAPRIVWVPVEGERRPAQEQQSELYDVHAERMLQCEIYVLGQDYTAAETLADALDAATFTSQTDRAVRITDERHSEQTITGAERHEIVLSATVKLPVTYRTRTAVTVTATAPAPPTGTITEE